MSRTTLAIDPSTTVTGWATDNGHYYAYGEFTAKPEDPREVRLGAMTTQIIDFLECTMIDVVIFYTPFARGRDATRCQWGMAGIIEGLAQNYGSAVLDVSEATVRAYHKIKVPKVKDLINGKEKPMPKGEQREWLKQKSLEIASELCDDQINSDDIADAVLLLDYAKSKIKGTP